MKASELLHDLLPESLARQHPSRSRPCSTEQCRSPTVDEARGPSDHELRARVAVEQASTFGWAQYTGLDGRIMGMKTFGASAPVKLQRKFGFRPEQVVAAAQELLGRK